MPGRITAADWVGILYLKNSGLGEKGLKFHDGKLSVLQWISLPIHSNWINALGFEAANPHFG